MSVGEIGLADFYLRRRKRGLRGGIRTGESDGTCGSNDVSIFAKRGRTGGEIRSYAGTSDGSGLATERIR